MSPRIFIQSTAVRFLLGAFIIALAGCVGTEVGNPADNTDVSVQFTGVEQPPPNALTLSSGVRIDEAWMVFSEASVELAESCDEDEEIDVDQPFVVELISGSELPGPNMFTRPRGNYCAFELELAGLTSDELPDDAPAELADISILVRGATSDGTPFVLRSTSEESISLEGEIVLSSESESLLMAFALDRWFAESGIEAASGDTNIVIDAENNTNVLEAVVEQIPDSALLIRDANGDGAAQPSELASPLADSAEDS